MIGVYTWTTGNGRKVPIFLEETGLPYRLHMVDIHLHRARLFHNVGTYPWNKRMDSNGRSVSPRGPVDDIADAQALIENCGYGRRKEQLNACWEASRNW